MRVIGKIFKALSIVFTVLLILLVLVMTGTAVLHRVRMKSNKEFMAERGYYNPVSTGDHSLNLVKYDGAENGHRIIALGGNGAGFPVELDALAQKLAGENQVYYLARAGFDGSDDVKQDMTVEYVVEDYRKALQNAEIEAPYVLMPHSYAGVLASYWVSKYPDEIEAMVDLDGLIVQSFDEEQIREAEEEVFGLDTFRLFINLGVADVATRAFFPEDPTYTEDEQCMSDAMELMTMGSRAFASDIRNAVVNVNDTWEQMQPNDVPKLYINSTNGYQTLEEYEAADVLSEHRINELTEGFEGSDAERRAKAYALDWESVQTYKTEKMEPYFEKLGNCEVVDLPGSHFIHWEQPAECEEIIRTFLAGLE